MTKFLQQRLIGATEWFKLQPGADSKKNLEEVEQLAARSLEQVGGGWRCPSPFPTD